jgi:putative tryptophan/tyrosine transport system substrate-binding protein
MKRREFITLLGGAAAAWPIAASAQQVRKVWRIAFVAAGGRPANFTSSSYAGFAEGMRELGYVDGNNVVIEWRFAEGEYERLFHIAAELASLNIDIIVVGASFVVQPMRQANVGTPIVMGYSIDPVGIGLVASLAHPGSNTTGLASALEEIVSKQIDLLVATVPNLRRLAVLYNPAQHVFRRSQKALETAARRAGINLRPTAAQSPKEIETAFEALAADRVDGLIGLADALFFTHRQRLAELALAARLPSIFSLPEYAEAGALMSYGDSLKEFYRRAAAFVDRIIKGARPGDLPVEQPTKFNFAINRKTAEMLGIAIPAHLYIFADEVIE